jgi:hypothetical protein
MSNVKEIPKALFCQKKRAKKKQTFLSKKANFFCQKKRAKKKQTFLPKKLDDYCATGEPKKA